MEILFKDSTERLDYLINECLEDIDLYGMYHSVAIIFKDGFVLEDYEHMGDLKLYADEKAFKVKMIELLIMLYSFKTNTKIGSVLRAYRMANDLSIEGLTKELDIPYRSYQDWELGNRTPNAKDLFKIIRHLEIDMEYIEEAFDITKIGGKGMESVLDLQSLTGQESGLVIYPDGVGVICNWSSIDGLPKISFAGIIGLGGEIPKVNGEWYNQEQVKLLLKKLDIKEWHDATSDNPNLSGIVGAKVYELEECVVIAPDDWN